jgi:hypothetical protein
MFNSQVLREIIDRGGIPFKEGAVSFIFSCPRCRKARKLYIRKTDGKFVCFVCRKDGFYGEAPYALKELYSIPLQELQNRLYGARVQQFSNFMDLKFNSPWLTNEEFGKEESTEGLGEVTLSPSFVGPNTNLFTPGQIYLNKRGIDDSRIRKYNILYNPVWRTVVFPVYEADRLVGWQERSTVNDFKYTLKHFQKEKTLMFLNNLNNSKHAILCEGPVDGIKTDLCGGGVVTMGKGVSSAQLDIIKARTRKLYLALDPDATEELDKICRHMFDYMDKIYILMPPKGKKDLGVCSFEEVFEQFQHAPLYCGQIFFDLKVK